MFVEMPPLRWLCKKIARNGLALGTQYSGSLALSGLLSSEPGVRVLTYHRFGDIPYDPFCVSVATFKEQMAYLAEHDLAISLADFLSYRKGKSTVPQDKILITIDDGYRSVYEHALPVLKQFGLPAVAFITPSLIQEKRNHTGHEKPEPYMCWSDILELTDNGISIGSHAWTHRSMGGMEDHEILEEAERSRRVLEERLSMPVTSFAYPFGTLADFNAKTTRILETAGYDCAFTSQHGAIKSQHKPYELPRVKVEGGEAVWLFRSLVKGGLDPWRFVDQLLWRMQANSND